VPELVAEVEEISGVVTRENPPSGVEVGDVGNIGAQPHLGAGIVRVDLERAEQPAESELLLVGQRLLRKDEDAAAVEGGLDLGKDRRRERTGEIDAAQFGAERRVERGHFDRHIPHPGTVAVVWASMWKRSIRRDAR
jgi:hypothetical protein